MRRFVGIVGLVTLVGALTMLSAASAGAATGTTCTGPLAPGTYNKVTVPAGASCLSDGPVTIKGGLEIGQGATFVLGSEDNAAPTGTINGGVRATNPASVQIHFTTINGGIKVQGGSGPFGGPFGMTWNAIEDNVIHGGTTITGYNGFWFGFIRNTVSGVVNLNDNVLQDPDGNEYVTNTIHGSLNCSGNSPAPQVGDSEGAPNVVTGRKNGQCTAV